MIKIASERFQVAIAEAIKLNDRKNKICTDFCNEIGKGKNKHSPNWGVQAVARTFLFAGAKLSGQIVDAVRIGHVQIATVALRSMFEMMVNSKYIYDHPKHRKDYRHMRRVAKNLIWIANKKRLTNHSKIDGKGLYQRMEELDLLHLYRSIYRELSEWSHLGIRAPYLSNQEVGERQGMNTMVLSICLAHDLIDSMCEGFGLKMDMQWDHEVVAFRDKYLSQHQNRGSSQTRLALTRARE